MSTVSSNIKLCALKTVVGKFVFEYQVVAFWLRAGRAVWLRGEVLNLLYRISSADVCCRKSLKPEWSLVFPLQTPSGSDYCHLLGGCPGMLFAQTLQDCQKNNSRNIKHMAVLICRKFFDFEQESQTPKCLFLDSFLMTVCS